MKKYTVTVKHDSGTYKMVFFSSNKKQLKKSVMRMEKCPESAIVSIEAEPTFKNLEKAFQI